ncbi:hypothetical protein MUK42_12762, partial [Musa troglodytarum]
YFRLPIGCDSVLGSSSVTASNRNLPSVQPKSGLGICWSIFHGTSKCPNSACRRAGPLRFQSIEVVVCSSSEKHRVIVSP